MEYPKPTKKELIEMLDNMAKNIEDLPAHAQMNFITHYDHWALMALLSSILKSSED